MKPETQTILATAPSLESLGKAVERFFVGNNPPTFNEDGSISRPKSDGQMKPYSGVKWDKKGSRYRFLMER